MIVQTRNFFWYNNTDKNDRERHSPIQIIAWEKICQSKYEGGLGTRKNEDVNVAFFVKQG